MAYNDKHGAYSTLLVRSRKHSLRDKRQVFRLLSALLITGQQKEARQRGSKQHHLCVLTIDLWVWKTKPHGANC